MLVVILQRLSVVLRQLLSICLISDVLIMIFLINICLHLLFVLMVVIVSVKIIVWFLPIRSFCLACYRGRIYERQSVLSNLKLRLSIGQTGNAEIGGNTYGYYGTGYNYVFGNAVVNGVAEKQLANRKLKWETTTEWNVGLDFGFLIIV